MEFLDSADPEEAVRLESHAQFLMDSIWGDLTQETKGGKYQSLATLTLAGICRGHDLPVCDVIPLEETIRILVEDTITAGTGYIGEIFVTFDSDGDGQKEFHQRTSLPHY